MERAGIRRSGAAVKREGVLRKGVWGGKNGDFFPHDPEITKAGETASDHRRSLRSWISRNLNFVAPTEVCATEVSTGYRCTVGPISSKENR
jgi:hypothetical protein